MPDHELRDVKTVYDEVCRSHDGITDFRAKLLALLPIVSGAGIFLLIGDKAPSKEILHHLLPIGVFGILITLGLFFYELRGIQECNGLIACARELEKELLPELWKFGAFNFKQDAVLWGAVGATGAALVIYPTVIGAWVYIAGVGFTNSLNLNRSVLVVAAGSAVSFSFLGLVVNLWQRKLLRQKLNP
jgi:hypothetical protein